MSSLSARTPARDTAAGTARSAAGARPDRGAVARRAARAVAVALAVVVPGAVLFGMLTTRIQDEAAHTAGVLGAAQALRPIGTLAVALADARAGAVSEGADAAAVRAAATAVDAVAAEPGGLPGGAERWTELRGPVGSAAGGDTAGPAVAQEYGTLGALTVALSAAVADTGGDLDGGRGGTRPLVDLTGTGLPALVTASAGYVDAVAAAVEVDDDPALLGRRAAAQVRVSDLAEDVEQQLASGVDPGAGELDGTLLARAGDLRAAVAALVPSSAFPAPDPDPRADPDRGPDDVERIRGQQRAVVQAAAGLHRAALDELSRRAGSRDTELANERTVTLVLGVLALLVAGWLSWTAFTGRTRPVAAPSVPSAPSTPAAPGAARPPEGRTPGRDVVTLDARRILGGPDGPARGGRAGPAPRGGELPTTTIEHRVPPRGPV